MLMIPRKTAYLIAHQIILTILAIFAETIVQVHFIRIQQLTNVLRIVRHLL